MSRNIENKKYIVIECMSFENTQPLIFDLVAQKFLEESGKVSKAKNKQPKQKKVLKKSNVKASDHGQDLREVKANTSLARPGTASTLDSKVEEIFQVRQININQRVHDHS